MCARVSQHNNQFCGFSVWLFLNIFGVCFHDHCPGHSSSHYLITIACLVHDIRGKLIRLATRHYRKHVESAFVWHTIGTRHQDIALRVVIQGTCSQGALRHSALYTSNAAMRIGRKSMCWLAWFVACCVQNVVVSQAFYS